MSDPHRDVKPAGPVQPTGAPTGATSPGGYARWRATTLGRVTGSRLWRSAHFSTAADLSTLVEHAGLAVDAVRGSVYYPPIGLLARALAPLDRWFGSVTTIGAAFIAVAASKNVPEMR